MFDFNNVDCQVPGLLRPARSGLTRGERGEVTAEGWVETVPVSCQISDHVLSQSRPSTPLSSHSPLLTIMELEALIKHLLSELRNRETVILDNIDSLKVNIVFYYSTVLYCYVRSVGILTRVISICVNTTTTTSFTNLLNLATVIPNTSN